MQTRPRTSSAADPVSSNIGRSGVGAAGDTTAADVEILPPLDGDPAVRIGCVEFNRSSVVNSPCFWILVGVALATGVYCAVQYSRRN